MFITKWIAVKSQVLVDCIYILISLPHKTPLT